MAHLNISSLRNKFNSLVPKIKNDIDILMISETKLDDSFPTRKFHTEGFGKSIMLDCNQNGGEIILFSREGIPIKLLFS